MRINTIQTYQNQNKKNPYFGMPAGWEKSAREEIVSDLAGEGIQKITKILNNSKIIHGSDDYRTKAMTEALLNEVEIQKRRDTL